MRSTTSWFASATRAATALLFLSLAAGCLPQAPPAEVEVEAGPAAEDGPSVVMNLDDAVVADLLQALAAAGRKPLVVDPDAEEITRCARVTLYAGDAVPVRSLVRLVGEALRPSGLSLVASADGYIVRRVPGAPLPHACETPPPTAETAASPQPDAPPESAAPEGDVMAQIIAGIRRISETQYEVTERARDLLFAEASRVTSRARIVPFRSQGEMIGFKMFGIRANDVLAKLGFQNGDALIRVANISVASPDKALEAYASTRGASAVDVRIQRQGQEMDIHYKLVPK